jgi:hypothetical protein
VVSSVSGALDKLVEDLVEDGVPKSPYKLFTENREALEELFRKTSPGRVLLLVDDLDRCHPEIATEILRAIHVFARSENLICLLAMDRDAIFPSLIARYRTEEQANEYLHKIIQLAVTPPRASSQKPEVLIEAVLGRRGFDSPPEARVGVGHEQLPGIKPAPTFDETKLRSAPWREFFLGSLCYNPRSFEKFHLIYEFRRSVLGEELAEGKIPDPIKTAAQAVIELRWPEWNWVAYRFPEAMGGFKTLMKSLSQEEMPKGGEYAVEALVKKFSILKSFLDNPTLCSFYQEYYRLRSQTDAPPADPAIATAGEAGHAD